MTREDISILLEKAAGLWLVVIGLDWLPELMNKWIKGVGAEDTSARELLLRTLVPLAAGAFLLFRKHAAAAMPAATQPPPSTMSRADWLWVGCKLVGACFGLMGTGYLMGSVVFIVVGPGSGDHWLLALSSLFAPAIWIVLGAFLFFGNGLWRLACRETPANG